MADKNCRACGALLSAGDKFCGECGAKVENSIQPPPGARPASSPPPQFAQAAAPSPTQPQIVHVYGATQYQPPPSPAFAIITLVFYFLIFPVGALLNVIGIFTGPRRGCFAAMLFLILLPTMILVGATIAIYATGTDREIEKFLREKMRAQAPQQNQIAPPMDDVVIPEFELRENPPTN